MLYHLNVARIHLPAHKPFQVLKQWKKNTLAITVVEKSLEIFGLVSNVIKNSTRAGGHILQNHLLIGVWLLVAGLQAQLTVSGLSAADKGKEEK